MNTSEIAENIRKKKELTDHITEQTGMSKKDLDKTLPSATSALRGAKVAQDEGADPSQMAASDLKKLDPASTGKEDAGKSNRELSKQEMLTMALLGTLPALIGYAAGGAEGGVAGAQAGGKGINILTEGIKDRDDKASKSAQQKEENEQKRIHLATESERAKNDALNKRRELDLKSRELGAKSSGKALAAEQADKLASHEFALSSLGDLKQAVVANTNKMGPMNGRLSSWNPFDTTGQALQTQIQSVLQNIGKSLEGGKMTDQDRVFYQEIMATKTNTPEAALKKIEGIERMVQNKKLADLRTYGKAGYDVSGFEMPVVQDASILHAQNNNGKKGKDASLGKQAFAAAPQPQFDKMSDDELKKYLGK
jgi:hypothetical protein